MKKMLMLVDPQCDFINGALPVPGAEQAMNDLARFLLERPDSYAAKIVTYDAHPHDHCSFRSQGGQWPKHCVRRSVGGAIWPALMDALYETKGEVIFLPKGQERDREEYSIFSNASAAEVIRNTIERLGIEQMDICGLAGDICVLATLQSGGALLGAEKFNVLEEFSPSIDGGRALAQYLEAGSKCDR